MAKKDEILFVNKIEMIPIEKLKPFPLNPRVNEQAVEPLAKLIKKYGMVVPCLVNKKNELIAGETRWKACKLLGVKKVPCVRGEHLSELEQKAFNIADNKVAEIATWNQDMLKDILEDIVAQHEANFDPSLVGFQQAEMDLIFQGWQSNAGRMGDVEADDSPAPGKIVIVCKQEDEEEVRIAIGEFIKDSGFEGLEIK